MRAETASEIVEIADEISGANAIHALAYEKPGELTNLHELEAKLASRIATGHIDANDGGKERLFLRRGPAAEMMFEVVQRDVESRGVIAAKSSGQVIKAIPKGVLTREQPFE